MNTNAALITPTSTAAPSASSHGRHARTATPAIQVIACPGSLTRRPLHARARMMPANDQPLVARMTREQLLKNMQGTGFNLSRKEQAFALGMGALFAALALAVMLF